MAKKLAIVLGVIFVIVGILGYISNPIAGANGIFLTNHAHDIVHILSGLVFIIVGAAYTSIASAVLKTFGVVYLLVALLGFVAVDATTGVGNILGLIAVNKADNWLHVVLAIVVFAAGVIAAKDTVIAPAMPSTPSGSQM